MKHQSSTNSSSLGHAETLSRDSSLGEITTVTWTLEKLAQSSEQDKLYNVAKMMKEANKTIICAGNGIGN